MRKYILVTLFSLGALIAWCQPTPRPGQKLLTPTLMPKGANTLVPANKTTTKTATSKSDSAEKSKLLPANLPMPKAANQDQDQPDSADKTKEHRSLAIEWMSIEEAVERSKTEKRKIVIDVYTSWCGWCKRMDQTTFQDQDVIDYINDNYYPVKFDAEIPETIEFNDMEYKFKKSGTRGYHELAAKWLNGRMGYPTTVFLNEDLEVIQPIPGYLSPEKFDVIIHYFGSDSHKTTPWESYERDYKERNNSNR